MGEVKVYINNDIDYLKFLRDKEIIIFGAGIVGNKLLLNLVSRGYKVIAFCDNDSNKQNQKICDVKVISFEELCLQNNEGLMIIICSNFENMIKQQLLDANIYNFISVSQIDLGGGEAYYDEQYFSYQKQMGEFGGKIKVGMFLPYIEKDMVVVEFGSGGGYLLHNIMAKEKTGIEINDFARAEAKKLGINSVKYIRDIPDDYADVIISTSVLEHVENPFEILRELKDKLKDGGKIIFHVPNESCDTEYCRSEINNHLYTWNCLTLGNLFKAAGYFVHSVQKVQEVWPKYFLQIEQEVSPQLFQVICEMGGKAFDKNSCIIVAYK